MSTRESGGPKFPQIEVSLSGEDGNIFFIMGRVTKAMRRASIDVAQIETFRKELHGSDSYDEALQTVMRLVSVS